LAIIPTVPTVVVGRLVGGAAIGAITAVQWRVAGDRSDAQRIFSLMVGTLIVSGAVYMGLLVPYLVPRFGASGLFAVLSVTSLVVGALAWVSLPVTAARASAPQSRSGWRVKPALLGCLGLAAVSTGVMCIGNYSILIGTSLGFKFSALTKALGVTGLLAALGPAAAHWLGKRAGLLPPLLGALVFVAIAPLVMVRAPWLLLFVGAMGVSGAALCFYLPYATTLISRIDLSRRFISAASFFDMIGNATGPAVGGALMAHYSARAVSVAATGLVGFGMILFSLAGYFGNPERDGVRSAATVAQDGK
jgi:predicted MFS family arabinose efflux permease